MRLRFVRNPARSTGNDSLPNRLSRPVEARDHCLGNPDAPITLVEYGSYDCSQCRAANERIAELREQFGERLRYVFRHRPVTGSDLALRAAELVEADLGLQNIPAGKTSDWKKQANGQAGIGFTMSLFIAGQSFPVPEDFAAAKIAVFIASVLAAAAGVAILWGGRRPRTSNSKPGPLTVAIVRSGSLCWRATCRPPAAPLEENIMAKGMEKKKETRKKPLKTKKEKRADKAAKKG